MPRNPEYPRTLFSRTITALGVGASAVTLIMSAGCGGEFEPGETMHTPFQYDTLGTPSESYRTPYTPLETFASVTPSVEPTLVEPTASPTAETSPAPAPTQDQDTTWITEGADRTCYYSFASDLIGRVSDVAVGRDGVVTLSDGTHTLKLDNGYYNLNDDIVTDEAGNPVTNAEGYEISWAGHATAARITGGAEMTAYVLDQEGDVVAHEKVLCAIGAAATGTAATSQ